MRTTLYSDHRFKHAIKSFSLTTDICNRLKQPLHVTVNQPLKLELVLVEVSELTLYTSMIKTKDGGRERTCTLKPHFNKVSSYTKISSLYRKICYKGVFLA